jgi:hypothetical protein
MRHACAQHLCANPLVCVECVSCVVHDTYPCTYTLEQPNPVSAHAHTQSTRTPQLVLHPAVVELLLAIRTLCWCVRVSWVCYG